MVDKLLLSKHIISHAAHFCGHTLNIRVDRIYHVVVKTSKSDEILTELLRDLGVLKLFLQLEELNFWIIVSNYLDLAVLLHLVRGCLLLYIKVEAYLRLSFLIVQFLLKIVEVLLLVEFSFLLHLDELCLLVGLGFILGRHDYRSLLLSFFPHFTLRL